MGWLSQYNRKDGEMNVLVTGGAGFIGSNLSEELVRRGYDVIILDDLSTGKEENIKGFRDRVRFVEGSVTNLELLKELFRDVDWFFIMLRFHLCSVP